MRSDRWGQARGVGTFQRYLAFSVAAASLLTFLLVPGALSATPVHAADASSAGAANGALFGLFPGGNDHTYPLADAFYGTGEALSPSLGVQGLATYLPAMVKWQGANNDVINLFETTGGEPQLLANQLPTIWDTYHSVPMISWSAITQDDLAAQGDYDAVVKAFALTIKQFVSGVDANGVPAPPGGRRIYLRPNWEANGNWYGWSPASNAATCDQLAQQEANYVAMWRRVHDVFMSTGGFNASQVAWVFSVSNGDYAPGLPYTCANGARDITRSIYPGDAYVDWVGIDGYDWYFQQATTAAAIFDPMVAELRSFTSRPISIDEVATGGQTQSTYAPLVPNRQWDGTSKADPTLLSLGIGAAQGNPDIPNTGHTAARKGPWIADYFNYLQKTGIKMSLWFNNNKEMDEAVFSEPGPQDPLSRGDSTYTTPNPLGVPTTYNTYSEYAAGVSSPYFISPDQANPRLLTTAQFLGFPTPTVASITPARGASAGGNLVTVSGTGFRAGGPTCDVKGVAFGGASAILTGTCTDTAVSVVAPPGLAGTVDVVVTTDGGPSAAGTGDRYTYVAPPQVTGLSRRYGVSFGGTMLTVTGSGFLGGLGSGCDISAVSFGSAAVSPDPTSCTDSSVQVSSPPMAPGELGIVDVVVSTTGGPSARTAADEFTYVGN
ncbi:MAG: IPT/TIG domain-containing protein [Candidatus Dormibacteria bacterium]